MLVGTRYQLGVDSGNQLSPGLPAIGKLIQLLLNSQSTSVLVVACLLTACCSHIHAYYNTMWLLTLAAVTVADLDQEAISWL